MNSTALNPLYDVGRDGDTSNQNRYIARDEVGYNLNYYSGDYKAIGGIAPFPDPSPQLNATGAYRPLYNGNINSMAVSIHQFNQPYLYDYKYDQLNRLKSVDVFAGLNTSTNAWNSSLTPTLAYSEKFNYDGNGNITKANRYASTVSTPMDSLTYHYLPNTNKLTYVTDQSQGWVNGNYKIKNQNSGNYDYDEIGNLVKDSTENISSGGIKWNVYGKISEVNKNASGVLTNVKKINYYYDAGGNRIGKKVIKFGSANVAYTWYVRDAQGNALATYTASKDTTATTTLGSFALMIAEHNLYGSSRLGTQNRQDIADQGTVGQPFYSSRGLKFFELSNHLGNVLTSISDKKIGHNNGAGGFDYYNAEVVSATDYYAFGMRSRYNYQDPISLDYRYGFNGKENDNEVKGGGDQIDYGARLYDPRLGRFLSVDPLESKFPNLSPYHFAYNDPIKHNDPDGMSGEVTIDEKTRTITVRSHIVLYSSNPNANPNLAKQVSSSIQNQWNAAHGTTKINGKIYNVKFDITGEFKQENSFFSTLASEVKGNTNIKNNYFRVETITDGLNSDPSTSYTDGTGANSGFFVMDQLEDESEKTGSHEFGHTLGLKHHTTKSVKGQPDIMTTQNNSVDKKYLEKKVKKGFSTPDLDKTKRKVTQQNIDDLGLDKLKYDKDGKANLGKQTNQYHTQ